MIPGWQIEAYDRLRIAIVKSAVDDLIKAMRRSHKLGTVCHEEAVLEKWFLSKWGEILCENRGSYIVNRCRSIQNAEKTQKSRQRMPDELQMKIYDDYKSGTRYKAILQKYKISSTTLYNILRRWDK